MISSNAPLNWSRVRDGVNGPSVYGPPDAVTGNEIVVDVFRISVTKSCAVPPPGNRNVFEIAIFS